MSIAGLIIYKTNFFRQVWENPKVNSFFLNIALLGISFMVSVLFYVCFIGPCCLRKEIDLEKDLPSLIPVMALTGVAIFFCSVLAMWPIWGFLTPIYMIAIFFGSSLSMMFLPEGNLGNLLFWVAAFGAGYISHTMPHEAEW